MTHLNNITDKKLKQFALRRRSLILQKGIFTIIVAAIICFSLVATLDYFVFINDSLRQVISALVYIGLAVLMYFSSLRLLFTSCDEKELARLFETANPELREKLLSAIELNEQYGKKNSFNEVIQKDISHELSVIDINNILPKSLISKRLKIASAMIVLCLILIFIPQLRFSTLLMRAMAPMANIERVSSIKIGIVKPSPAEGTVAQGDAISFIIQVSDPEIKVAWFEYTGKEGLNEQISMQKIGEDRFETTINSSLKELKYRFRAHTAQTRYYTLKSIPRPRILNFEKTYNFPKYSLLKNKKERNESGNIKALEGTNVTVKMTADQNISQGEIQLEMISGETKIIPLQVKPDRTLTATLPILSSSTYKVYLTAAETLFDNKFSPRYEIEALVDVLPAVSLHEPNKDITVPLNYILPLKGSASDDLGIAEVFIEYKKNSGKWQQQSITKSNQKNITLDYPWDLKNLKLKAGDEVSFRLLAKDFKKNLAISSSLHLNIVSDGFNPDRLKRLSTFRKSLKDLQQLQKQAQELQVSFDKKFNNLINHKQDTASTEIQLNALIDLSQKNLTNLAKRSGSFLLNRDAKDFSLTARVLSYQWRNFLEKAMTSTQDLKNNKDKTQQKIIADRAKHNIHMFSRNIKLMKEYYSRIMAQAAGDIAVSDFNRLQWEQTNISENQSLLTLENTVRRQNSFLKTYQAEHRLLKEIRTIADHGIHHRLDGIMRIMKDTEKHSQDLLSKGPSLENGSFTEEYFTNDKLQHKKYTKQNKQIHLNTNRSPAKGIAKDYWSAKWTGLITTARDGEYTFFIKANGGCRLWLNDKIVMDKFDHKTTQEFQYKAKMAQHKMAKFRLDYRHFEKQAQVEVHWQGPQMSRRRLEAARENKFNFSSLINTSKRSSTEVGHLHKDLIRKAAEARRGLKALMLDFKDEMKRASQKMTELANAEKAKDEKRSGELQKEVKQELKKLQERLQDQAQIEEKMPQADHQFVKDTANTAKAIKKLQENFIDNEENKAKTLEDLAQAFEDLETAHKLKKAREKLEEFAADERNPLNESQVATTPEDWQETEDDLKKITQQIKQGSEKDQQAADELNKSLNSQEARNIRNEMNRRKPEKKTQKDLSEDLDKLASAIANAEASQKENQEQARETLKTHAPTIAEELKKLAEEAKQQKDNIAEVQEKNNKGETEITEELIAQQQNFDEKVNEIKEALKRMANAQDIASTEGREKARDADDAIAKLKEEKPSSTIEKMKAAKKNDNPEEKKRLLEEAKTQQENLIKDLEQLADHFNEEDKDAPQLAESRQELRQEEAEDNFDEKLNAQYKEAEELAELSEKKIDQQIKALENKLAKDSDMQQALAEIAKENDRKAAEKLLNISEEETALTEDLSKSKGNDKKQKNAMQKQAKKQQTIAEATSDIAEDFARSQRHQERLGDENSAQQSQALQEKTSETSESMKQAEAALATQENFQEAQSKVTDAKNKALEAAQKAMQNTLTDQEQASPKSTPTTSNPEQQLSKKLAQALDKLDQAKTAIQKAQQAQSPQTESQAQEAIQQAQQAIQQAQQMQAQTMAQSRQTDSQSSEPSDAAGEASTGELAQVDEKRKNDNDWGRLPKKMITDLKNTEKEKVPEQYQKMVNAYFKAIAENAQKEGQ